MAAHFLQLPMWRLCRRAIHSTCHVLPKPIMDYITAVNSHLDYICDYTGDELTPQLKLNFFQETRHTFGQSALVLSGGGALGAFHLVRTNTCAFA